MEKDKKETKEIKPEKKETKAKKPRKTSYEAGNRVALLKHRVNNMKKALKGMLKTVKHMPNESEKANVSKQDAVKAGVPKDLKELTYGVENIIRELNNATEDAMFKPPE